MMKEPNLNMLRDPPLYGVRRKGAGSAARLSGIFGYFCFPDKSDSPISLRSKRGETAFALADFALAKPCLSIRTKFANSQLWVTPQSPKPSPKRDRAITKATAVSPLSPTVNQSCGPTACIVQPTKSQTFNCGLLGYLRSLHSNGTESSRRQKRYLR